MRKTVVLERAGKPVVQRVRQKKKRGIKLGARAAHPRASPRLGPGG